MTPLVVLGGAFVVAAAGSDLILAGAKVQTGLLRVLVVYAVLGAVLLVYLRWTQTAGAVAFLIYWAGAFLTWFGIRSHIESSILLRMLAFLRDGARSRAELLALYEEHYSLAQRMDELTRAGLVRPGLHGPEPTRKGAFIARAAAWLR